MKLKIKDDEIILLLNKSLTLEVSEKGFVLRNGEDLIIDGSLICSTNKINIMKNTNKRIKVITFKMGNKKKNKKFK